LIILNIIAWGFVFDFRREKLKVSFFDVGQGDAIFIETPKRHQILIDGGPSVLILEKLGKEMPFWDRTLDLVILTHPEHDHMAGLIEVLKRYKVKNILWTGVKRETGEYEEWLNVLKEERKEGAQIFIAKSGQKIISATKSDTIILEVLYPFEVLEDEVFQNSNNTSVVTKLNSQKATFLFTGDIYQSVEKQLLKKRLDLTADILKVAHHGSKTSTCEEFLSKVNPEIAVISVGKENRYGHPHLKTLVLLRKYGIKILRTDIEGDISFQFNYGENSISNF